MKQSEIGKTQPIVDSKQKIKYLLLKMHIDFMESNAN